MTPQPASTPPSARPPGVGTPGTAETGSGPHIVVSESPNAPRPADPLVRDVADILSRIEINYEREGSGPGSRFAGRLLQDVQAEAAVRAVRAELEER